MRSTGVIQPHHCSCPTLQYNYIAQGELPCNMTASSNVAEYGAAECIVSIIII